MKLNNSSLHFVIIDTFLNRGCAPTVEELAHKFAVDPPRMCDALRSLEDYHGVVLHPDCCEIWVVHPFSTVPTGFLVANGEREWWGNCAWCSLGLAAIAEQPVTIKTSPGYDRPPVELVIKGWRTSKRSVCCALPDSNVTSLEQRNGNLFDDAAF